MRGPATQVSFGLVFMLAMFCGCRKQSSIVNNASGSPTSPVAAASHAKQETESELVWATLYDDPLDDKLDRLLEQCVLPTTRRLLLFLKNEPLLVELELLENGQPLRHSWLAAAQTLTSAADDDGDGVTAWDELMSNELLGGNRDEASSPANREMVAAAYDTNGNQQVDGEELIRFLNRDNKGQGFLVIRSPFVQIVRSTDIFSWLDRSADEQLDQDELHNVALRLTARDADGDGKIWLADFRSNARLAAAAMNQQPRTAKRDEVLDVDEIEDWNLALYDLQTAYSFGDVLTIADLPPSSAVAKLDEDGDGTIRVDELRWLPYCRPDAIVRIDLTDELDVLHIEPLATPLHAEASSRVQSQLHNDAFRLQVRVIDQLPNDASDEQLALVKARFQASLDNLSDDLFSQFDTDGSDFIDASEVAVAAQALRQFDSNRDAMVSQNELASGKILVLGRAPVQNQPPVLDQQPIANTPPANQAMWFTHMDANRNGFVERAEFLGTAEQFEAMDASGDGRLTAEEAGGLRASDATNGDS